MSTVLNGICYMTRLCNSKPGFWTVNRLIHIPRDLHILLSIGLSNKHRVKNSRFLGGHLTQGLSATLYLMRKSARCRRFDKCAASIGNFSGRGHEPHPIVPGPDEFPTDGCEWRASECPLVQQKCQSTATPKTDFLLCIAAAVIQSRCTKSLLKNVLHAAPQS